ncbi:MAG: AAA family ATPase [Candidatus Sericytochromatia bacterium]|nr:AAA family ATPase [Candidatus Sericytochromatia bacterium]
MRGYKALFGITGAPFSPSLPVAALHRYPQFEELAEYFAHVAEEGSVGMVTGEIGVGKSTAVRTFLNGLDGRRYHVCYVGNADAARSVFRRLAWSFGMRAAHLQGDLRDDVHVRIEALWREHNKRTILVVDEAHLLSKKALQELRLLTNFTCDSATPLGLFLVGQPQLRAELKAMPNRALDQRIMIRYHLAGLSKKETTAYMQAHLSAVGAKDGVFTPEAIAAIFQHADGLPRQINKIAIQSLLKAGHKGISPIDADLIAAVLKDMDQE